MSILETIRNRVSVRSYSSEEIPAAMLGKIHAMIDQLPKGPFHSEISIHLLEGDAEVAKGKRRLGTYGFISGAKKYLAVVTSDKDKSLYDAGYLLERVILFCTENGLGTCWLGGTFDRHAFHSSLTLSDNERILAVSPVGFPAQKRTFMERTVRLLASSDNRKPWSNLFFEKDGLKPLIRQERWRWGEALEMVRLSPSATNKQPWRVVVDLDEEIFGFYLDHDPIYSLMKEYDIQKLDLGIAMAHFELSLKDCGLSGSWNHARSGERGPKDRWELVSEFRLD